jgi:hypothetical protein
MPHFCPKCKSDEFICQKCGKVFCSNPSCHRGTVYHWSPKITGNESAGAVCDNCYTKHSNIEVVKGGKLMDNNKIKEAERVGITAKIITDIEKYLQSRLNLSSLYFEDVEVYNHDTTVDLQSEKILNPEHFGIFKHMIKDVTIVVRIWIGENGRLSIRPYFHYNHPNGGSNGHELDFNLEYFRDMLREV